MPAEAESGSTNPVQSNLDPVAITQEETVKRRLKAVPEGPGVYLFRDHRAQVIYVGKALRLRDRLRQYFTTGYGETARVAELVRKIYDFEFVTTANEVEALVLECNLIKNYRPRFNIRLKDDKNYLYLKLPVTEEFPRVHYSRRVQKDGALYFGPYTSAQSLRGTVKSIRQLLPFRTCSDEIFRQGKVCLDFHIKRCPGPCERRISSEDYKARIHEVALFMEGRSDRPARLRERGPLPRPAPVHRADRRPPEGADPRARRPRPRRLRAQRRRGLRRGGVRAPGQDGRARRARARRRRRRAGERAAARVSAAVLRERHSHPSLDHPSRAGGGA
ncbi:MAG: hypothetical protein E6J40_14970 [Chloroflexi bacterium]|nr:MAG: hypothetical protein E6J40_14970 [Chloroflexota bacterium]